MCTTYNNLHTGISNLYIDICIKYKYNNLHINIVIYIWICRSNLKVYNKINQKKDINNQFHGSFKHICIVIITIFSFITVELFHLM